MPKALSNTAESVVLDSFHPLIADWFRDRIGAPTDIQTQAWPVIASGEHVLITAPTGSGKTLTAFLTAINSFFSGHHAHSGRVLYISPLKALNNDINRNLQEPLAGIREYFDTEGKPFPLIRTAVRSGDTDPAERREMLRHPPDILITTPESLQVLLASKNGHRLLTSIETVILDEIHAVASTKRGVYLMSAVERLALLNGEFQRIALSATVNPTALVAEFVGGFRLYGHGAEARHERRNVVCIASHSVKKYDISVGFSGGEVEPGERDSLWQAAAAGLRNIITLNRSTLLFANSRRMVEKITRFINENAQTDLAYSHHGSLSKEIRTVVEQRLKNGELAAIVATGSLELGIDIGTVDEVVLLQPPYSTSSTLQRIGRAGHGVGETSRGTFMPVHASDLLASAVLAAHLGPDDIEPVTPVECPLDVLAQEILSRTLFEKRNLDDIFAEIRTAWPYRNLSKREFDLVVEMLAGRYADTRIRELLPRLMVDRIGNTARARNNTAILIYRAGGVIPDRGYYTLRVSGTKARVGELDEEFVWERSLGDAFPYGNQIWRIQKITHNDVEASPVAQSNSLTPFWRAEDQHRSWLLSERIGSFLEAAEESHISGTFRDALKDDHHLTPAAVERLTAYLRDQRVATGHLPHRHLIVIEHYRDPANVHDAKQVIIYTFWGGQVNRPFALALAAAWEEKYGYPLELFSNNDCILLNLPHELDAAEIVTLVEKADIAGLLRRKLESTGFFAAHFRENAQRALLLPRRRFDERMPLWLNRLRSKKLLAAVSRFEDFPITLETWRTCLADEFDIPTLEKLMGEIADGSIAIHEAATTTPSPFADNIIWRQTNYYMYQDDTPASSLRTNLSDELLREVLHTPHLRPRLSDALITGFVEKLQRCAEGYAPATPDDLLEWVKDRHFIPREEWESLLKAIRRDYGFSEEDIVSPILGSLHITGPGTLSGSVMALEMTPRVSHALGILSDIASDVEKKMGRREDVRDTDIDPLVSFLMVWLRYYGPVTFSFITRTLGLTDDSLSVAIETLIESRTVIFDELREPVSGNEPAIREICECGNLETLLRLRRRAAQPSFKPLDIEQLQLFLATYQGLTQPGENTEGLQEHLNSLFGYPARAGLWETDIFPARLNPYYPEWLDTVLHESDLVWFGTGNERTTFCFGSDFDLFGNKLGYTSEGGDSENNSCIDALVSLFASTPGRLTLPDMATMIHRPLDETASAVWELVWRGQITNDDYETLRNGIRHRFRIEPAADNRSGRRSGFNRWKQSRPFTGVWYPISQQDALSDDLLECDSLNRDRVRILLGRYGIVFRELLWREPPLFQWRSLFPSLRLMELSGELVTGHFFSGISGPQFCTPSVLRILTGGLSDNVTYWMNADDPASLCGIGIDTLRGSLPQRIPSTHIAYREHRPVLISRKNGEELDIFIDPDNPALSDVLSMFRILLGRRFQPLKKIQVETINGVPATESPYRTPLVNFGFERDYRSLILRRSFE